MSNIGYDAVTIGNHDFDNGIDGLASQMHHANFLLYHQTMTSVILF